DGETAVVCLVSKEYKRSSGVRYWFGFYPSQYDELQRAQRGLVALGCGSADTVLLIAIGDFASLVAEVHRTFLDKGTLRWHIDLSREQDRLVLRRRKGSLGIDLTPYLI
ncbi:MAG: hypothetical protein OXG27_10570, partial [Chloroflexi bacterium]|nr:hypothetical protein [Chloroflexota bacterium]